MGIKKGIRIAIKGIGIGLLLCVALPWIIYIPFVQQAAIHTAESYINQQGGMQLSVGKIGLRFPLRLTVQEVVVLSHPTDTLVACQRVAVGVELLPLLRGEIVVKELEVNNTHVAYSDTTSHLSIAINIEQLKLTAKPIDLHKKEVYIPLITLQGGDVNLYLGKRKQERDTTTATPLPWQIKVERIALDTIHFAMQMDSTLIAAYLPKARIDSGVVELATQRITVQQLELYNTNGSYGKQGATPRAGLDLNALAVERLELVVESFINQGSNVQLALRHLSGVERSGFNIESLHGIFLLDSTTISLQNCGIYTPHSSLSITAKAAEPILQVSKQAPLSIQLQGTVGGDDVATLYPTLPLQPYPTVALDSYISGTLDSLQLHQLRANIPDVATLQVSGYANYVTQLEKISGTTSVVATLSQPAYLSPYLGEIATSLPHPIHIALDAVATSKVVQPSLKIELAEGELTVAGSYNIDQQTYQATTTLQQLPLGRLLELPDMGNIGGTITINGGITPLSLQATASIDLLEYREYNYSNTTLTATLLADSLTASIVTASSGVVAAIDAAVHRDSTLYSGLLHLAIDTLELARLGFSTSPTLITGVATATGAIQHESYQLALAAEQLQLSLGDQQQAILIDTLHLALEQQNSRMCYDLAIGEANAYLKELSQLHINGFIDQDTLQVALLQPNSLEIDGARFDIGARVVREDSTMHISLFPEHAILANERWHINPDNYLTIYPHQRFAAKLEMERAGKQLMLHSLELESMPQGALSLKLGGIELAALLATTPIAGKIAGELAADVKIGFKQQRPQVVGDVTLGRLRYEQHNIGTLTLDVDYEMATSTAQQLDATLELEQQEIMKLAGSYSRTTAGDSLQLVLSIQELPMHLANPFLPAEMVQIEGAINSRIELQGAADMPRLDGYLTLIEGVVNTPMAKSRFLLGRSDTITITNNLVTLRRFALRGSNKNPLYLDGTVDINNPALPYLDLQLTANDMEVINVKRGNDTDLYGTVDIDVNSTIKGVVDRLQVRGDVSILNGTDVTYVMKDSPLGVKGQSESLVTFINFAESQQQPLSNEKAPPIRPTGIDMLLNIDIANAVKGGVNLSSDGQNSLFVQGGGNLSYTINRLGDSQFIGKYALSGGTVSYNPPIISEKEFAISEGSYVVWSGDIANPSFHITAVEKVRTNVTEEGSTGRLVNFNIIIVIANTLDNLSITFDLAAPEDLTIQNELTSLTAEQRASQAMNLLIYNTYTGPGTTAKIASNPLNTFIQKELNSWARNNVKVVDVSFGIDTDDGGLLGGRNSQTNYSYQVSKSFFDDRVKVVVGGGYETNSDSSENLEQNLIDDLSVEYMLDKRENMYIELFRHTGYESILEGEITQTGIGFVIRKKLLNLKQLFKKSNHK